VLFAALYLRRRIVYAVLTAFAVAEATVLFTLEPFATATTDLAVVTTGLGISGLVVMALRERADSLVDALEEQALTDPLTGLANRRAFTRAIEQVVARRGPAGEPVSLVTLDLDLFKAVNDAHGHPAGDAVLRAVADALRLVVRQSDVVARLGGDEFAVLLEAGPRRAAEVAGELRAAVAHRHDLPGGPPTLSVGVATLPGDADTVDGLLAASDAALYRDKLTRRAEPAANAATPLPSR
jgi:diguanylate cyclase (GGDEF)-like protein